MAYDGDALYFTADAEYEPGRLFVGGSYIRTAPVDEYHSAIRAIDPVSGTRRWEFEVPSKSMSGVLSTAGRLVFTGTVTGNFIALDAETGDSLWQSWLGGEIIAAPMTYVSSAGNRSRLPLAEPSSRSRFPRTNRRHVVSLDKVCWLINLGSAPAY